MILTLEVHRKNQHASNADALLYTPMHAGLTAKHSRVYRFEYDGDEAALITFAKEVLQDAVSQETHIGEEAAISGALFHLDYGMKAGALDLEKEAVMNYYKNRNSKSDSFTIKSLTISQRYYIFGNGNADELSPRFVKDMVNPAVHKYSVAK